jgi:hypothetical protein
MQTALSRRILGDIIGCVTLAALVGLLVYVWPGETTLNKFKELFRPIYILLAILGYACWIEKERTMPGVSWLLGTSWSIVAGIVSLAGGYSDRSFRQPLRLASQSTFIGGIPIRRYAFPLPRIHVHHHCRMDAKPGHSPS